MNPQIIRDALALANADGWTSLDRTILATSDLDPDTALDYHPNNTYTGRAGTLTMETILPLVAAYGDAAKGIRVTGWTDNAGERWVNVLVLTDDPKPFDGIELKARREGLGLNQEEMALVLGVKQATLSRWESGIAAPRDPVSVELALTQIEDLQNQLIDELCETAQHSSALLDNPQVKITTYRTDAAYWEADARARELTIPSGLHRCAAAWAKRTLYIDSEIDAQIVEKQ